MERAADVILRDGRTMRVRAPRPADGEAVAALLAGLSERSRYLRFQGGVDSAAVGASVTPDWDDRGALVGVVPEGDGERVVALATWMRLRDPAVAEVAFAVADPAQARGIGTRLLERLAESAAEAGVRTFVADVLAENRPMLGVFQAAGFAVSASATGGSVEVRFPIAPTESYRERVDMRDHVAVRASLEPFFRPRSVAVLGASPRRGTIGGELFRNVLAGDFTGAAYPVNRGAEPVGGVRGYADIADLPEAPDLAVVCVPGRHVNGAVRGALETGVRAICVISAGFAETGAEGEARQHELVDLVRGHGARLIGPNCLGVAVTGVRMNATFAPHAFPPGTIGFSSQSGALGLALLAKARSRGLGLSAFVSIGNKADVSSNDLLEWWEDDPETALVLLYLESFGNPRKFGRIARRVARRKPLLAMKSGRTAAGAQAASSHTAALAGSEAAVDALFRQAGVIRAATLGELVDVAALLSAQPLPAGRRVAVLTNAGGLGILCADACHEARLELPDLSPATRERLLAALPAEGSVENPVDMLGSATAATYAAALPPVLEDPEIDSVIVLFAPPVVAGAADVARAVADAVTAADAAKPVVTSLLGGEEAAAVLASAGRPVTDFAYPESAARALGRAADRADWLRRPAGRVPALEGIDADAAAAAVGPLAAGDDRWLDPDAARALLEAYGVPVVPQAVAESAAEAVEAAARLGFPAVVKSAAAGAHKTETGGVAVRLGDADAVREAAERIGPPVIVQPMIAGTAELLAGVVQDPVFGPTVAFGPGGTMAELIGEARFAITPLTDIDARELVLAGKAGRLVAGWRGAPAADVDALTDLVLRLGRLADDLPEVAELDLNPVMALPEGCVAVDMRVRVRHAERRALQKTW